MSAKAMASSGGRTDHHPKSVDISTDILAGVAPGDRFLNHAWGLVYAGGVVVSLAIDARFGLAQGVSVVFAAEQIVDRVKERAEEIEQARRLPADLAAQLASGGLFRMLVPESVGGLQVAPRAFSEALQTLSAADAAVGWCVMIGATSGLSAAYLEPDAARQIFGDPDMITGGVFAPLGRAVVDGDDFVVTGRWPWASGSANCRWLAGGCMIMQGNEVRRRSDGAPDSRFILFPRADVELIDTWRASGMRGTGSGDMAVHEVRVPQTHAVSLTDDALNNAPLYKFPVFGLLAVGIASVALGNAKGALDALRTLATAKRPQFSRRSLAERSMVQAEFARASARWRAALALLDEVVDRCWASAQQEGPLSIEIRADLRLACTHATRESAEVATTAYELGGGTSVYSSHPLQRHFRDAHVATQHIMVSPPSYELTGRVLFGLDADTSML